MCSVGVDVDSEEGGTGDEGDDRQTVYFLSSFLQTQFRHLLFTIASATLQHSNLHILLLPTEFLHSLAYSAQLRTPVCVQFIDKNVRIVVKMRAPVAN